MIRTVLCVSNSTSSSEEVNSKHVNEIRKASMVSNFKNDISGVLAYNRGKYFQVVEGERPQVDRLLERIKYDDRNTNFSIVFDVVSQNRIYPNWSFVTQRTSKEQSDLFNKFLRLNIDALPMLGAYEHGLVETFVDKIFH